jgi:hypothetical protein
VSFTRTLLGRRYEGMGRQQCHRHLLVAFIAIEYKQGPRAMLVHNILGKREVCVGAMFSFFLSGALFLLIYFLPIYFQAIRGTSAVQSGIRHLALVIPICEYRSSFCDIGRTD